VSGRHAHGTQWQHQGLHGSRCKDGLIDAVHECNVSKRWPVLAAREVGSTFTVYEANWKCPLCKYENYASRFKCTRCKGKKPEGTDNILPNPALDQVRLNSNLPEKCSPNWRDPQSASFYGPGCITAIQG
jgi:hypothetical protein